MPNKKNPNYVRWGVLALIAVVLIWVASSFISYSNREVELRNTFTQQSSQRTTLFDNVWKTLSGKSQVAVRNDSSFQRNIAVIMNARKDSASNLVFKFVKEANPNANYSEVAKLYEDLSRTIESKRDEFQDQEVKLQDVKLQHDNLVSKFPGSLFLAILGRDRLKYVPITSDRTDQVMKTGKDNDTRVF